MEEKTDENDRPAEHSAGNADPNYGASHRHHGCDLADLPSTINPSFPIDDSPSRAKVVIANDLICAQCSGHVCRTCGPALPRLARRRLGTTLRTGHASLDGRRSDVRGLHLRWRRPVPGLRVSPGSAANGARRSRHLGAISQATRLGDVSLGPQHAERAARTHLGKLYAGSPGLAARDIARAAAAGSKRTSLIALAAPIRPWLCRGHAGI